MNRLKKGDINGNIGDNKNHIVKLVCGKGNGRKSRTDTGLKEAFLEYFKKQKIDFVYLP